MSLGGNRVAMRVSFMVITDCFVVSHAQTSPLTYAYLVRCDIKADDALEVGGIERPNGYRVGTAFNKRP